MARLTLALLLLCCPLTAGAGPVIVVDPGHGGTKPGAMSPTGQAEKNLALEVARRVKAQLEARLGATVTMTRERDASVSLPERVEKANRLRPDLFLSIHMNSMPTRRQRRLANGIETYFLSASASGSEARRVAARENAEVDAQPAGPGGDTLAFILADLQRAEAHHDSSRLAYAVHEALVAGTGAVDRGVQQAPFYVLMGLAAPAVLCEVGYISHPVEGKKLAQAEYQEQIATAITTGVASFLSTVATREARPGPQ